MNNEAVITAFYANNYDKMISFVCNRAKGGDGLRATKTQAEDIVATTFIYFLDNIEKFKPKWIWNKLIQMRKNFHRDMVVESIRKKEYKQHIENLDLNSHTDYDDEEEEEFFLYLKKEITNITNVKHKEIIKSYLRKESLPTSTERMVISRFKTKQKEKHNECMDNGHRE